MSNAKSLTEDARMNTKRLDRNTLHGIITTYDMTRLTDVPNVPTLLFERWGFSKQEVREALGLRPDDDVVDGLSGYLEAEFGIGDLA